MTALQWDQVGDRRYETGVDRGVLYMLDGRAVAWNGLTSVEDATTSEVQDFYLDGVKYLQRQIPGDYAGSLKAYTYPDMFDEVLGVKSVHEGLVYYDQVPQMFHLSYRTRIGNDVDGEDHGYRLHVLYYLRATPSARSFDAISDVSKPSEFSWNLTGTPAVAAGFRPTCHIAIDSTKCDPERLQDMEELLYGTASAAPTLPMIEDFANMYDQFFNLMIYNNGDGTWTAIDQGNDYIVDDGDGDPTTFKIDNADTTVVDANTYTISDTITD